MFENQISPRAIDPNLTDYGQACSEFTWDDCNERFTWHTTGRCNIVNEAIDRHAADPRRAGRTCLICTVGEKTTRITYAEMRALSSRLGAALQNLGVRTGDPVCIFLPTCPEMYIAMAACARIGALITPLYNNYREDAVRERLLDAGTRLVITDRTHRGRVPDETLPALEHIIVTGSGQTPCAAKEHSWCDLMAVSPDDLDPVWVDRDHPLLLIYTSGRDGTPVGLLHAHDAMRGYLMTARWVLDVKDTDVLWTHGRPGWFMGAAYSAFAPWLCGITSVVTGKMHTARDLYRIIDGHRVSILYTIPTVYRLVIEAGEKAAAAYGLKSLRHLLSVLEPLQPEDIYAVMRILGFPVHDTWWSAETGMITIANFPCMTIKPGYLGRPVPGIEAAVVDDGHRPAGPFTMGELALKEGWPAMLRGVRGRPELYDRYRQHRPWFMSGDIAFQDHDGYFYYQGRADDVIVSDAGKIGVPEIEAVIMRHPAVADAGLVRTPDERGRKLLKAFVQLRENITPDEQTAVHIQTFVAENLSPDITPAIVRFCDALPRDTDGTVMRRVLKAWDLGLPTGDITKLR